MPSIEFAGDDLLSIRLDSMQDVHRIAAHLLDTATWLEVVPGIESVVVQFDALSVAASDARRALERQVGEAPANYMPPESVIEIAVAYGGESGPDLPDVCRQLGMTQQEFIDLHTGVEQVVDLVGFTPGFVYIGGLGERLAVPRRGNPRQHVPAGSIGVADGRTGIYALPSPGGWSLVGRTTHVLFDADADEPLVLKAGMRVRFTAVGAP